MPSHHLMSNYGLDKHGITNVHRVHWNHNTPSLYEAIVTRGEGAIVHLGPIAVRTGQYTGRAAKDKFIVEDERSKDKVWWGEVNRPFAPENFTLLFHRLQAYLQGRELFVQDCFAGRDPQYRLPIRIITETAWHSLFARNIFVQATPEELQSHIPEFTVIHIPNFHADPELDGTRTEAFILINLDKKLVLIGGTSYAGEIKKAIFTVSNYLLPQEEVMTMHCSANVGENGDVAIFFGLSGTGKTTLSADPLRKLIGDDEHGWSDRGVFNFEGGCYAKAFELSKDDEPEIYETTRKFGTVLENVAYDHVTRRLDLDDDSLTENTRAAYPISHIPNAIREGAGGHPRNIIMLTSDAFGIMPPIAKLTPEQAMYHFLSGYTAKLGGTEKGMGNEPQATFSACFGAPFMVLHPSAYAKLLADKIRRHDVTCWLVSTGWTGGPYGVGSRMKIAHSRAVVNAALDGSLQSGRFKEDPIFGFQVPTECPGVPKTLLSPRDTWSSAEDYDKKARELADMFHANFKKLGDRVPPEAAQAGPK